MIHSLGEPFGWINLHTVFKYYMYTGLCNIYCHGTETQMCFCWKTQFAQDQELVRTDSGGFAPFAEVARLSSLLCLTSWLGSSCTCWWGLRPTSMFPAGSKQPCSVQLQPAFTASGLYPIQLATMLDCVWSGQRDCRTSCTEKDCTTKGTANHQNDDFHWI